MVRERDAKSSGGVELTREQLGALIGEAERGYDADQLRERVGRGRGRPPLGAEAAAVFHVRLPDALQEALKQAADAEQTTPSDVVRRALHEYLARAAQSRGHASSA